MTAAKNSTEVLKAAKWILENVGWHQGNWSLYDPVKDKAVAFCAIGAINRVVIDGGNYQDASIRVHAKLRLAQALPKKYREGVAWSDVVSFNDDKKTTKEMVLRLFDKAIKGDKQ